MFIYLLATLDTKEPEAVFLRDRLRDWGLATRLVDISCSSQANFQADVSRQQLLAAADLPDVGRLPRGEAVEQLSQAAERTIVEAQRRGEVAGVLGIGGSAGTTICARAMRALPLGVPKLLVSTLASGQVRPYVGDKDLLMLNAVVDFAGINRISRLVLQNAAAALAGMVQRPAPPGVNDKPLIAATMFGVTTPCVQQARAVLEAAGYEVLVFHATGSGGSAMESLIADRQFAGVLDITTTELADELVGGVLSAGPTRLTAAARVGVPQVVSVGALDMVNFGPRDSVPEKFAQRQFHIHNANVTLMRTTPEDNAQLGAEIGRKVGASTAPATILLPRGGVSAIDRAGQPFDDPLAREALFNAILREHGRAEVVELPQHINDPEFATFAAQRLLQLIAQTQTKTSSLR